MSNLWRLLTRRQRVLFVVLVLVNLVAAGAEVLGVFSVLPFLALASDPGLCETQPFLRSLYDGCGFQSQLSFVIAAGIATVASLVLTNVIAIGSLWFRTWYCNQVITDMSDRLLRGYLTQPYEFFLSRNASVLGKDLLNEAHGFFTYALEPLTVLIARILQIAAVAIALLFFDWRTTVSAALLFGGFYVAIYLALTKRITRYGYDRYVANEQRFRLASEALGGMKELKLFGRERWYADAFDSASQTMVRTQGRLAVYSLSPRYALEVLVFSAVVLAVLWKLANGEPFQKLAPSLSVFAIAGLRLLPSIQLAFQYTTALAAGDVAIERLHSLFETVGALDTMPHLPTHHEAPLPLARQIDVENVSFTYAGTDRAVLDRLSLTIPAGQCVGLCGPSGSGKTTLMDLCLGLLTPNEGSIRVDDMVISAANASQWQRNIGYVPQSIYLIDGSIAENIAFSTDSRAIDMAAVERAARLAHLDDVIANAVNGFDTLVGDRGVRLSGGQRQRVAIARALYRDPEVLFFDEATSALDAASEAQVVEAIQSLAHMKTIVVVAHRLSTLRYCDTIYTISDGRIVRCCTYAELVNEPPASHGAAKTSRHVPGESI